jgi:hypothetical protein
VNFHGVSFSGNFLGRVALKVNHGETIINGKASGTSLNLPPARKNPGREAGV